MPKLASPVGQQGLTIVVMDGGSHSDNHSNKILPSFWEKSSRSDTIRYFPASAPGTFVDWECKRGVTLQRLLYESANCHLRGAL